MMSRLTWAKSRIVGHSSSLKLWLCFGRRHCFSGEEIIGRWFRGWSQLPRPGPTPACTAVVRPSRRPSPTRKQSWGRSVLIDIRYAFGFGNARCSNSATSFPTVALELPLLGSTSTDYSRLKVKCVARFRLPSSAAPNCEGLMWTGPKQRTSVQHRSLSGPFAFPPSLIPSVALAPQVVKAKRLCMLLFSISHQLTMHCKTPSFSR